ncbi:ribonuclease T [Tabrizicola sp. TH137]|uniref:ribonuclease T2 family protein n=1 Tax=Tabrizicola sp. TH137 TaxID=2067452 RepID=UPI000C79E494|nr:ribonuclease T2 [Tabrizicola sp. TH137]PLL14330.1 ribonuclease T [Tabrizicola sp. TH137]
MRVIFAALMALALAGVARAEGERAGYFDYYVMALSWSANWCAREGDARNDPQCDAGRGVDFVLHGLWPQYEEGWPSFCRTAERDPPRSLTAAQADLFGGAGAAFYQWKKHGRCSGLSAAGFYDLARQARARVAVPEVFRGLARDIRLEADVVEEAFLEANPTLAPDGVVVTCRDGLVQELRICLTSGLEFRTCGEDVGRVCRGVVGMEAVR